MDNILFSKTKNFAFSAISKIQEERIAESSAALSFYLTLATFPALISLIAILAFLPIDGLEQNLLSLITQNIPGNAGDFLIKVIKEVLTEKKPTLLSFGFFATIWISSSGMTALINQLNFAFKVKENRGFTHKRIVSVGLTLIYVLALIFISFVIILGEKINLYIHITLGFSYLANTIFFILKYIFGFFVLLLTFSSIFCLAPSHRQKFNLFSFGSIFSSLTLVLASVGFNFYISNFASYNEIYGSLGGIIIYMLWLYIAGYILLLGAEINAAIN